MALERDQLMRSETKWLPKNPKKFGDLDEGEHLDRQQPGFGLRVTGAGHRSFFIRKRVKGSSDIIRFALDSAKFPPSDIEEARDEARRLIKLIASGGDPRVEEKQRLAAQTKKRKNTFESVAQDFIDLKLPDERRGDDVKRDIKKELLPIWGPFPITEITDDEVVRVVKLRARKKWRGKPTKVRARNMLALIKRLFAWAIEEREYGIKINPAALIRAKTFTGKATKRDRTLEDDELIALWRSAKRMGFPYGSAYQLLLLTGLRLNEVARAERGEFDTKKRVWIVPAARMKGRDGDARPHAVPLTAEMLDIFTNLPELEGGEFLFSLTPSLKPGKVPVQISDKIKKKLDRRMLRTLRALAKLRGEDVDEVELPHWTNHDIRRTVRSRLSRLKISEEAREAVLAHARPGIKGTYDVHDYADEKREALELWAAALMRIVEPRRDNVRRLRA
jgi:integrase